MRVGSPSSTSAPSSNSAARSQNCSTALMSCVTSTIVRPSSCMRFSVSMHFCWKAASPTASTSSMSRMSASSCDEHGEREADLHPGRVVLQPQVDEVLELGELDRRVEAPARLGRAEPEHDRVDDDVLARGEIGVEADAELDERAHAPAHADRPAVDAVDPGDALHQRALAAAVAPGDAEELALADLEGDVLQRAELFELAVADRMKDPLLDREGGFARDPKRL